MNPGGGIPALVECLRHRFYARLNLQDVIEQTGSRAVFRMLDCRVQSAGKRKGLADHPCKSVGLVEYSEFAKTIDSRIRTRCIACPPDEHPEEFWSPGICYMICNQGKRERSPFAGTWWRLPPGALANASGYCGPARRVGLLWPSRHRNPNVSGGFRSSEES